MAERTRRIVARTLARSLATAALGFAALAAQAADETWYQVEVLLFEQAAAAADTIETIDVTAAPRWPQAAVALQPPWPEAVRPARVAELGMLWDTASGAPQLVQVSPGLNPEIEAVIRWLRRLERRSSSPSLAWLGELDRLDFDLAALQVRADAALAGPAADAASDATAENRVPAAAEAAAAAAEDDDPALAATDELGAAGADVAEPDPNAVGEDAAQADHPVPMALAFRQLEPSALALTDEARQLRRSSSFRLLAHFGWRQPFVQDGPGVPIAVELRDEDGSARLLGAIDIELRRYLHVDVDLFWREPRADETAWVHVTGERRMRSAEVHYIDHPRVGALLRLTPFALAAPLSAETPVVARVAD